MRAATTFNYTRWDVKDTERAALWGSYLVLNDDFFKAILTNPVPVRMMTLLALKKSPLGLDLYAWATFEAYKAQAKRQGRFIAWKLLHEQFGTEISTVKNFVAKAKRELQKIMCNCPTIKLSFARGGVQIHAGSLPDVSPKEERDALQPPPPALPISKNAPSGDAIAQVIHMGIKDSAVMLAAKFQEGVKEGRFENTDEAYISFAKQHLKKDETTGAKVSFLTGAKVSLPIVLPVKNPISAKTKVFCQPHCCKETEFF